MNSLHFDLFTIKSVSLTTNDDFRQMASIMFRLLQELCELTKKIVESQIRTFITTNFISQQNNAINVFKESTQNTFLRSFRLISNTTEGNTLLSGLFTNTKLIVNPLKQIPEDDSLYVVDSVEQIYNKTDGSQCSCSKLDSRDKNCFQQMSIYNLTFAFIDYYSAYEVYNQKEFVTSVPGMYIGCYIAPALLFSHLACFFDEDCLSSIQFNETFILPLNNSLPSHYLPNTTIGELVENLMIEDWNNQTSYDNYFSACQPQICQYTVTNHSTFIFIFTMIIGISGGLVKVYRFLIPLLVRFIRRYL